MKKKGYELKLGDVFTLRGLHVVVIEESNKVGSAPPGERFGNYPAHRCCEPRVAYLGLTGRVTHQVTYIILPKEKEVTVHHTLDLDHSGATPKPV